VKVVFTSYDGPADIGGVSSWLQRLLPELKAAGWDVELHLFNLGTPPGLNEQLLSAAGIACRSTCWPATTEQGVEQCLQWLQAAAPHVYVANCITSAYFAAALASREAGLPSIGVLHSDEPFYHGLIEEFVAGSSRWRLDAMVAVSRYLDSCVGNVAWAGLRRACIPCGVPIPARPVRPEPPPLRLVWTGRMVEEQKCASATAQAIRLVLEAFPEARACMAGDGPAMPSVRAILQNQISAGRAQLPGRLDAAAIERELAASHVFVLLSEYEGLPVSLLEAMATGCVPVCRRMRSGISELICDRVNGLVVDDRQQGFISAISELRSDSALRTRLAANARQTVLDNYSIAACTAQWLQLLEQSVAARNPQAIKTAQRVRLPPKNPKLGAYDRRALSPLHRLVARLRRGLSTG
jgi:colanic acid/amylovoran biosynthesis glycosyltransferase